MWQSYLTGLLVAFGLFMASGAQNAFVLAQGLRREHHVSVALLCIVCDAVLVALGVFGLASLLMQNPTLLAVARWGKAFWAWPPEIIVATQVVTVRPTTEGLARSTWSAAPSTGLAAKARMAPARVA